MYVCVLTEQMDMDKSTRLVILIENIYTLWACHASFCLLHAFEQRYYSLFLTIFDSRRVYKSELLSDHSLINGDIH